MDKNIMKCFGVGFEKDDEYFASSLKEIAVSIAKISKRRKMASEIATPK